MVAPVRVALAPSNDFAEMVGAAWRVTGLYRAARHRGMPPTLEVERSGVLISFKPVERAPMVPLASLAGF